MTKTSEVLPCWTALPLYKLDKQQPTVSQLVSLRHPNMLHTVCCLPATPCLPVCPLPHNSLVPTLLRCTRTTTIIHPCQGQVCNSLFSSPPAASSAALTAASAAALLRVYSVSALPALSRRLSTKVRRL